MPFQYSCLILLLFFNCLAIADEPKKFVDTSKKVEVWADDPGRSFQMRWLKPTAFDAGSLELTVQDKNGKGIQTEFRAMDMDKNMYRFSIPSRNQVGSFLGFELKFRLKSGESQVLRSHK